MELVFRINPIEARVLGVLIEKAMTTPDLYPLTLNALTNGTNQKSNRDPYMMLEEEEVWRALQTLSEKHLAETVYPMNSRVEKYRHKAKDMLGLDATGMAILAELMLRGPQSPGELRGRAARMAPIESLEALSQALEPMMQKGFVKRLPPEAGSRAERYAQLIAPDAHSLDAPARPERPTPVAETGLEVRVEALEREVRELRAALETLRESLGG